MSHRNPTSPPPKRAWDGGSQPEEHTQQGTLTSVPDNNSVLNICIFSSHYYSPTSHTDASLASTPSNIDVLNRTGTILLALGRLEALALALAMLAGNAGVGSRSGSGAVITAEVTCRDCGVSSAGGVDDWGA